MGKRVNFTIINRAGKVSDTFKATIIGDYPKFYVVDRGIYKTCINKADIHCGHVLVN